MIKLLYALTIGAASALVYAALGRVVTAYTVARAKPPTRMRVFVREQIADAFEVQLPVMTTIAANGEVRNAHVPALPVMLTTSVDELARSKVPPAAAWATPVVMGGGLWVKLDWTPVGRDAWRNGARFLMPTAIVDNEGRATRLVGLALETRAMYS